MHISDISATKKQSLPQNTLLEKELICTATLQQPMGVYHDHSLDRSEGLVHLLVIVNLKTMAHRTSE